MSNSLDFLEDLSPNPSAYYAAVRQLRDAASQLRSLRIGIAASFRAEPLANYLIVEGARRGFHFAPWFTPYGQFELQCATPESALFAERPDVVIIATRLEDLAPTLWRDFEALSDAETQEIVDQACARVESLIASVRRSSPASIVVFNYSEPLHGSWGIRRSPAKVVEYANTRIDRIAADTPGTVVYDFGRLALEMGLAQLFDPRLDYVSRLPFAPAAQIAIARGLARVIRALHIPPAKCLVLDLDNTLWGGVVGEVGLGGIALGDDYPGRVYRDFQAAVRAFRHRGVLLAVASKNNDIEARQVFEQHPDMVLRWEDFAAFQIHWKDKASSLRAIAEQLHISLDALVLYDDSPIERAWVRNELPEVGVIEVPDDMLLRVAALESCEAFDQVSVSAEDRQRTILYEVDRQRELAREESSSFSGFLSTLQIRVGVGAVDGSTLPRVAQLIQKTNQFNLTGRRRTEAELQAQLAAGAIGYWLRASDRFGDYGLVGAAFAILDSPGVWRIDNFVMSCRILGRQVESALLAAITRQAFDSGAVRLIGDFVASPRNAAAQDFYRLQGFEAEGDHWLWDFARGVIPLPSHLIPTEGFLPAVGIAPSTLLVPTGGEEPTALNGPAVGPAPMMGGEPTVSTVPTTGTVPGLGTPPTTNGSQNDERLQDKVVLPNNVGPTPRSAADPLVGLSTDKQILPIGEPRTVGPLPAGRPGGRPQTGGSAPHSDPSYSDASPSSSAKKP